VKYEIIRSLINNGVTIVTEISDRKLGKHAVPGNYASPPKSFEHYWMVSDSSWYAVSYLETLSKNQPSFPHPLCYKSFYARKNSVYPASV
jgi:hypothetical protein